MREQRNIGRFANAELIGQGGFGSVYRADDVDHGRQVAIKVLRGVLGETERRRFDRERQTMGRLGSHPNIIPMHESGYTEHGEAYLVMELAPGGSLGDRLEAGQRLPWAEATAVAVAIARAAQAAHDHGVLHRDIKPDNILIDAYDNPRLTDFGIASVANNATATTSTTATLAHAAPEVLEGRGPTPAVDIYAIGSTLFNLITGSAPYERPGDDGVTALIARTLTEAPPDLRPWGVPDPVAAVVERALAKDATHRPQTAAQLADELAAAMATAQSPAVGVVPTAGGGDEPGNQTMVVAPPYGATPPPTAGGAVGPQASASAHHGAGPAHSSSGSSGRWLLIGVAGALLLALIGVGAALALGGGDNGEVATDSSNPGETSTSTSTGDSTTSEPSTTTSSEPTTTTTTTSTTTTSTTSTTSTTTSTTATTAVTSAPIPGCGTRVLDGQTTRFDIEICSRSSALTYRGTNRENGQTITLPACFRTEGVFLAENEGFTYVIDIVAETLEVVDPGGDVVVDEPFLSSPVLDLSGSGTRCT